jgi:hypothetical protein
MIYTIKFVKREAKKKIGGRKKDRRTKERSIATVGEEQRLLPFQKATSVALSSPRE